jgi:hypothetical protein
LWRRRAAAGVVALVTGLGLAGPASALSVSAPASMSFTSVATTDAGTTITASLGNVMAADSGILGILLGSFTASVSTTVFTTGGGGTWETIQKTSIKYLSGTASAHQGTCTAGQTTTPVDLSQSRTAYSCSGLLNVSATWNPTISVTLPTPLIAGSYTATITHSVA